MRRIKELATSLFLLSLIVLGGCKSTKVAKVTEPTGNKMHNEFFDSMKESAFRFNTLTASLKVELNMPKNNMSSRVEMKMVRDSAFQLSVQPFLGIEMFRIEISTDSVKVMDRINKRYVSESYAGLKGQTPIDFNFYNLQALFTNRLFLPGEQDISARQYNRFLLKQEGTRAEIKVKDVMELLYTFVADGEQKLLSTHISDSSERFLLGWNYTDFRMVEKQPFPMLMETEIVADGAPVGGINFRFSRIQVDVPVAMEFSIPSKYTRITFAQVLKALTNITK
ncbi:MAG: DUF4292 domain-containing protein [Tannerellaceae bacterium]